MATCSASYCFFYLVIIHMLCKEQNNIVIVLSISPFLIAFCVHIWLYVLFSLTLDFCFMLETVLCKYLYPFFHFLTTSFKSSISKHIPSFLELRSQGLLQCADVFASSLIECSEDRFSLLDVSTPFSTCCTFNCFSV